MNDLKNCIKMLDVELSLVCGWNKSSSKQITWTMKVFKTVFKIESISSDCIHVFAGSGEIIMRPSLDCAQSGASPHLHTATTHAATLHNCHNYRSKLYWPTRNTGLLWLADPILSSRPFGHVLTVLCVIVLCELHGFIVHCLLAMQMWNSNSNSPLGTHIIIINIAQCGVQGRCISVSVV